MKTFVYTHQWKRKNIPNHKFMDITNNMRVSEAKDRIQFCPTEHMKADCLTKSTVPREIRDHVFYHNPAMRRKKKTKADEDEEQLVEEEETNAMFTLTGAVCCFLSVTEHLEREWIPQSQRAR